MRKNMYALLTILCFSLLTASLTRADDNPDTVGYRGTFWSETNGSVGTMHYDFSPYGFQPDSIMISINELDSIVFRRISNAPGVDSGDGWRIQNGRLCLKGTLPFELSTDTNGPYGAWIKGYYQDAVNTTQTVWGRARFYDRISYLGLGGQMWAPSFGYFKSDLEKPLDDEGVFIGWSAAMGMVTPRWSCMLSTSWSGLGKHFAFSEPFRTEFRWFTRTHGKVVPELIVGGGLSKIKVRRDDHEFRKVTWGADIGAALKVPFHRLTYRYSTAADGYHTAELYIAMTEDDRSGGGTTYQFRSNGDIWTVRVGLHLDFAVFDDLEPSGSHSTKIFRRDSRPWPLKVLAYGAALPLLPLVPVALVTKALQGDR